ncbi:MAG: lipid-A-disaccharide synthase, partial [Acidobacteria bacterium]|nr:lipid-A-disaccharide synthase [Acidobacteriota bacterium]
SEVISKLPTIYRAFKNFSDIIKRQKPDALIVIDFPDFHFKLIKKAKEINIPVIYYITPQVWAWRKGRTKFLKEYVDLALNILPFEEDFLRKDGVNAFYVGHPLLDIKREMISKEDFLKKNGIAEGKKIVAMLPGSRDSEVKSHLKTLVKTAQILNQKRNDIIFVTPKAKGVSEKIWEVKPLENFFFIENFYYETLSYSDLAMVASGTASLECALNGLPSVVFYSLNPLTYFLGKKLVKLPFVSLPNIILEREVFKEVIQKEFTAENCSSLLEEKIDNLAEEREKSLKIKDEIVEKLGRSGASQRAAQKILDFLK